jgi:O-antigen/teichoic acid export membrane protein
LPIVPIVYALTGFGVMRAFGASAGSLFLALGRPDLRTKIQIAQLVVFAGSIYPLYLHFGVIGVAWAATLYGCLSVYAAYLCFQLCELSLSTIAGPSLQIGVATATGALAAWASAHGLAKYPLAALIVGGIAGLAATFGALVWLDRQGAAGYRHELTRVLSVLRRRRA